MTFDIVDRLSAAINKEAAKAPPLAETELLRLLSDSMGEIKSLRRRRNELEKEIQEWRQR